MIRVRGHRYVSLGEICQNNLGKNVSPTAHLAGFLSREPVD